MNFSFVQELAGSLTNLGGNTDASWNVASEVMEAYKSPGRYYHNMCHVYQCLKTFSTRCSKSLSHEDKQAIELALWFHDVVYDHARHDNEEMSASMLLSCANKCGIDSAVIEISRGAILATKHQIIPEKIIDKWVVDVDLSILGESEKNFDKYERDIRKEFSHIDDLNWVTGRTNFLNKMLEREWIYSTPDFRRLYEGPARGNIKRSIARLDKGEVLV